MVTGRDSKGEKKHIVCLKSNSSAPRAKAVSVQGLKNLTRFKEQRLECVKTAQKQTPVKERGDKDEGEKISVK